MNCGEADPGASCSIRVRFRRERPSVKRFGDGALLIPRPWRIMRIGTLKGTGEGLPWDLLELHPGIVAPLRRPAPCTCAVSKQNLKSLWLSIRW